MHAISNPLSPGNGDLRVVLSGHFCASLHVGHARSIRPVFDYRITGVEAQIKTKQTNKCLPVVTKVFLVTNKYAPLANSVTIFFKVVPQ